MILDLAAFQPLMISFVLVLSRTSGLVMTAPMLGAGMAGARSRLMLAVALALVLTPFTSAPAVAGFSPALLVDVAAQLAIGIAMGLVLQIAFEALLLAGEAISAGSGLSFAQMVDPVRGTNVAAIGGLFTAFAMLAFLSQDGHLAAIKLLAESFKQMPLGAALPVGPLAQSIVAEGSRMFAGALQVALPGVIALLAVNLAMGVASRAAPSLNLFSVGLPASVLACLLVLYFGFDVFIHGWLGVMSGSLEMLARLWS